MDGREAVRCSLGLLDCGPPEITAPLLAAVYLAPLSSILNPDTSVWLYGASGSLKSTLSGLAQSHFGAFDHKTLSASWTSTDNALLARLHVLKDVLSVIDDYAPQDDSRAQTELNRRVQRVLRDVGNRAARGRLDGDLRERPEHPPRGFLLCNGEMLPPGHSINARLRSRRGRPQAPGPDCDHRRCKRALPSAACHACLSCLAGTKARRAENIPSSGRATSCGGLSIASGLHLRQPEALANLYLGIDLFLSFAVDVGGISVPGR